MNARLIQRLSAARRSRAPGATLAPKRLRELQNFLAEAAPAWLPGEATTLIALAGGDTLDGCDGKDVLRGSLGNDSIFGGSGFDQLNAGQGNDTRSC